MDQVLLFQDPSFLSSIHKLVCNARSMESNALFWPLQAPDMHMVHRYM